MSNLVRIFPSFSKPARRAGQKKLILFGGPADRRSADLLVELETTLRLNPHVR